MCESVIFQSKSIKINIKIEEIKTSVKELTAQIAKERDMKLATDVTGWVFILIPTMMGNKRWKYVLDVTGRAQLNVRDAGGEVQ